MNLRSKLARVAALLFSLTLLAGYVVYSHVTPNTPPADPLGINAIKVMFEPDVAEVKSFPDQSGPDFRIIGSKAINQPIFQVRKLETRRGAEFAPTLADFMSLDIENVKSLEPTPGVSGDTPPPPSFLKPSIDLFELPENIRKIMAPRGDTAVIIEKMLTPEKLSLDSYERAWESRRLIIMPGSKSGGIYIEIPPVWAGESASH